jgi:hypothetical protein
MNLEIQFNANIIKKVKSLHFQVDQLGSALLVLFALYEGRIDLLDEFDDFNKQKRAIILYKELETRDLITFTQDEASTVFTLTKEGIELVEFIKKEFEAIDEDINTEIIAISGVETLKDEPDKDSVEGWIDEWLEIFPRGVKSGGKLLRSDRASCIRKMKNFMLEYKYSKDTIMRATERYIEHKRLQEFQYTRCAVYFIYHVANGDKTSDLAAECEQLLFEDNNKPTQNNFDILV